MDCIICGNRMTSWPGGGGYGNNPSPWPSPAAARIIEDSDDRALYRCCDTCNSTVVIPLRLSLLAR